MKQNRETGGILLIAGTCIGAGMLALPITLGQSGFWLSSLFLIVCWLCTYVCGLYVLEANLYTEEGGNYISMADNLLGRFGKVVAWLTYLLLLYSLMAAYLTGGGGIVRDVVYRFTDVDVNALISPLPWIAVVGTIIYLGTRYVDGLNRLLVVGLLATYLSLVLFSVPHTQINQINDGKLGYGLAALPVLATAFGYHVIIPSLRTYMHGDVKRLSMTVLIGSAIPLVIYLFWNFVVFGTIPIEGTQSLSMINAGGGQPSELTNVMAQLLHAPWLKSVTQIFIFFAIASSFLGISLSLFDFLADGFHIKKNVMGRVMLGMITFFPPFLYAVLYPKGFVLALSYAGVFVAILHGILPAMMVWAGRHQYRERRYQAPGGFVGMIAIILVSVAVIVAQVLLNFGVLQPYG